MTERLPRALSRKRIRINKKRLVPDQEAYIRKLAREFEAALLSCAPIDEQEAEAYLSQAYRVAGLEPPSVRWFDSPIASLQTYYEQFEHDEMQEFVNVQRSGRSWILNVKQKLIESMWRRKPDDGQCALVAECIRSCFSWRRNKLTSVDDVVSNGVWNIWKSSLEDSIRIKIEYSMDGRLGENLGERMWSHVRTSVWDLQLVRQLALCSFYHEMHEENSDLHLMHFYEMVSGAHFGVSEAWVIRKPIRYAFDEYGRMHSAEGPCIEYRDGWKLYAWHGVLVPERVILHPEGLTREDWLREPDLEVRRIIQERMPNFVEQVGGRFIDGGTRGCLYAVDLRGDPEGVAHYVQVLDNSTGREYYLRVPPSIHRADEAVAWTFGLSEQDYQPVQES